MHSFIHSLIHSYSHSFILSIILPFIRSFFHSFIHSSILPGANSIHNTPGIAFQEEVSTSIRRPDESVPVSKKRSIDIPAESPPTKFQKINPKFNPPVFTKTSDNNINKQNNLLSLWKTARYKFRGDQRFPRYTGFVIQHTQSDRPKTVMTYLPPIEKPITDYSTLFEVLHRAEKLSKEANMKYCHIVMDCGAAMKTFHVIWNNTTRYSKVLIHLGDFHCMQAFFGVIGQYVTASGFEDIVFQLGLCQPGSMNALIKGKHYNQAWLIHEAFAEAVTRIFIQLYLPEIPKKFDNMDCDNVGVLLDDDEVKKFLNAFNEKFTKGLQGEYGATAQYWLTYVRLVDILQNFHQAIQTNNFDDRLTAWKSMMPYFFFFNRTHYSR